HAKVVSESGGSHSPGAKLEVHKLALRGSFGVLQLQVNKNRPGAKVHVEVGTLEKRGSLEIFRNIEMEAPSGAFSFDRHLRPARPRPRAPLPPPAAHARPAKPRNRWRGNLTVDLPGRANVRLTAGGYEATLEHAERHVTR